ncbi:DNRLRE domain-containing protein [Candidatus Fermentibacteria bacterium]|nr:DNRLRE domain-containing protein [Candidatus Fermentibacteria bacterium]
MNRICAVAVAVFVWTAVALAQPSTTIELYPADAATINGTVPGNDADAETTVEPRVLLRFDLSQIPGGMQVEYAELIVGEVTLPPGIEYVGFVVAPVLEPWNGDDVSWDQTGAGAEWNDPGGDWDREDFTYGAAGVALRRPPFFNVTTLVRDWVSGTSDVANYGFLLMPVEGTPNTDALVGILDATQLRPVLTVQYGK